MAPALAEAGAAYARAVALFDGSNAEELAAARAQWKKLKSFRDYNLDKSGARCIMAVIGDFHVRQPSRSPLH